MNVRFHISRDYRTGAPLDVARDRYRYECADIPVDVDVCIVDDDVDIGPATIAEDIHGMEETCVNGETHAVCTDALLFRAGQPITLTDAEECDALAEYHHQNEDCIFSL